MIKVNESAVEKLRSELTQKCFDANVGFRIIISVGDGGKLNAALRFDKKREGDTIIELEGVKLFCDPKSAIMVDDYHLDYLSDPDGGFYLIKLPKKKQGRTNDAT